MAEVMVLTKNERTWEELFTHLDGLYPSEYAPGRRYRDAISTLLSTAGARMDAHPDETARRMQTAAASYRAQDSNALRPRDTGEAGLTVLAAHTAALWLLSFLDRRLPRLGGELDLHQDLGRLVTAVWGPADRAGLVDAAGQLHRTAALRAEELHGLGAYTAVSDLTGYATASSIHTAHGRLVHNTLSLALPHDRPTPGGALHLTLAQALEQAVDRARHRRSACGGGPATPGAGAAPVVPWQTDVGPLDALNKAVDTRAPGLLASPLRDARGVLPMLWHGRPEDAQALDHEAEQILAVAYLLGGRYRRAYRSGGTWNRLQAGLVVLAAETSARTLHSLIVQEHGPYGFEALKLLIPDLHPREDHVRDESVSRAMNAHRMLAGHCGPLLDHWQHRAVKLVADAVAVPGKNQVRLLARISAEVYVRCHPYPEVVARARKEAIGSHLAVVDDERRAHALLTSQKAERRLVRERARRENKARQTRRTQWRERQKAEREHEIAELTRIRQEQRTERAQRQEEAERGKAQRVLDRGEARSLRLDAQWQKAEQSVAREQARHLQRAARVAWRIAQDRERTARDDGFLDAFTELLREGYPILAALQTLEVSQSRLASLRFRVPEARERITASYRDGQLARALRKDRLASADGSPSEQEKNTRAIVLAALRTGSDLPGAAMEASTTPHWIIKQYRTNQYFRRQVIESYDRGPAALLEDLDAYGYRDPASHHGSAGR